MRRETFLLCHLFFFCASSNHRLKLPFTMLPYDDRWVFFFFNVLKYGRCHPAASPGPRHQRLGLAGIFLGSPSWGTGTCLQVTRLMNHIKLWQRRCASRVGGFGGTSQWLMSGYSWPLFRGVQLRTARHIVRGPKSPDKLLLFVADTLLLRLFW